jgi:hypothetical protein
MDVGFWELLFDVVGCLQDTPGCSFNIIYYMDTSKLSGFNVRAGHTWLLTLGDEFRFVFAS